MSDKSAFGFETPEDSLGFLLWKTTVSWQRRIKLVLEPSGLSHAQFVIMAVARWLKETSREPTQVAIANLSGLDKMTVSKSLKKLAAVGLVSRSENAHDTRAKVVVLTNAGNQLIEKLVPAVESMDKRFFDCAHEADHEALIKIFRQLIKAE